MKEVLVPLVFKLLYERALRNTE